MVFTILLKFDNHFLGLRREILFRIATVDLLHLKLLKNIKKECNVL